MEKLGQEKSTNREVFYLSTQTENWASQLPTEKWLVLTIVDKRDNDLLDIVAHACLDKKVSYICTIGQECEYTHDWFDETMVERSLIDSDYDLEYMPTTTWDEDFDEGFWFALKVAFDPMEEINTVVCLDLTENGYKDKLTELLVKINDGWEPEG